MAKFHINEHGEVKPCTAPSPEKCRVKNFTGDKSKHFENEIIARKENEKLLTLQYQKIPKFRQSKNTKNKNNVRTPHFLEIDKNTENLLNDLNNIGKPLIVGGAVRDSLIGVNSKDIDIEVYGTDLNEIAKSLRRKRWHVDEVGKQFGVLKVKRKGTNEQIDVSVPRKENKTGAGHRKFEVEMNKDMTIEEAISRRDFTFNTLMYDNSTKELIDITGGKKDFENGIIRHVSEKFKEDPLRVLRAFQFASRFNMKIAPETAVFSKNLKNEYKLLSNERVQEEYNKFWTRGTNYQAGLKVLQETEWDDTEPGLKYSIAKILPKVNNIHNINNLTNDNKIILGSALIGSEMNDKNRENFIRKTIVGDTNKASVRKLINATNIDLDTPVKRKLYSETSGFTFKNLYNFGVILNDDKNKNIALNAKNEGVWEKPVDLFVQGRDILPLTDKKPGKWMGELLNNFKLRQYNNEFKDKNDAINKLKELF